MRKLALVILIILLILLPVGAAAEGTDGMLDDQYNSYDFSEADRIFEEYSSDGSFSSIVRDILSGNFNPENSFWENMLVIAVPKINEFLLGFVLLFALSLLLSVIKSASGDTASRFKELFTTISNAVFALILFTGFFSVAKQASVAMSGLAGALDAVVPLLTVALIASGGSATASVLNPESAVISQMVNNILTNVALPAVIILAVFIILDSVFVKDKFTGVVSFGKSAVTWCVGVIFTVYASIISIKGLAAASYDGISLRTVRYAINNSVPLVGSLAGDGVNLALACCSMVKSAIGIASFILIILSVLSPLMSMVVYMLLLKCFTACISPFAPGETISMISAVADLMKLLISAVVGMTVIFLIIIGIAVGAANVI